MRPASTVAVETETDMRTPIDRFSFAPSAVRLVRWPDRPGEVFIWALLIATGLRAFSFGTTGLDWDESFYIVVAQRWLNGGVPYADVWDILGESSDKHHCGKVSEPRRLRKKIAEMDKRWLSAGEFPGIPRLILAVEAVTRNDEHWYVRRHAMFP